MTIAMGRNSWILGVRDVVAILFGLYALLVPGSALATLILVFGLCILVEGVVGIVAAIRVHDHRERSLPIATLERSSTESTRTSTRCLRTSRPRSRAWTPIS